MMDADDRTKGVGDWESYVVYLYFEHNNNCVQGGGETWR